MRKIVVSITLAMVILSGVGYARPNPGKDHSPPPPNPPPQHRSDRALRPQPRPENNQRPQQQQPPPQSRPERKDPAPHPVRDERQPVQPPVKAPPNLQQPNSHPPNPQPPNQPFSAPSGQERIPGNSAPDASNQPASAERSAAGGNTDVAQPLLDIASIVDTFLGIAALFR